ncbi:MAG: hypothetical protein BWY80_00856 [Firmicutes bacterium ADurb.Bin456]|nr:MAG: hypothetical protein BWY80_00856 [Firmicutes bacterium ADurb.Bin456]
MAEVFIFLVAAVVRCIYTDLLIGCPAAIAQAPPVIPDVTIPFQGEAVLKVPGDFGYPVQIFGLPGHLVNIKHGPGQAQVLVVRDTHPVAPVRRTFSENIIAGPSRLAPFILVNTYSVPGGLKIDVCLAVIGG